MFRRDPAPLLMSFVFLAGGLLCACNDDGVEVRYFFGLHGAYYDVPSAHRSFGFGMQSSTPLYVLGHDSIRTVTPFHAVLDVWDETSGQFLPISSELGSFQFDSAPQVIQVSGYVFYISVDFTIYEGELRELYPSGNVRCRLRIPLLVYDGVKGSYRFHSVAVSESFVVQMEMGNVVNVKDDRRAVDSPGGLPLSEHWKLHGVSIDIDSIDTGLREMGQQK